MTRRRIGKRERLELWTACGGVCGGRPDGSVDTGPSGGCGGKIQEGLEVAELDHVVALANGGADGWSNYQLLHTKCHRGRGAKTTSDMEDLAAWTRHQDRQKFGRPRPRCQLPGAKRSPWKRRMDGTLVRRT